MKLEQLLESPIAVREGPVIWKQINDLLNKGDYKGAADLFLSKGGNARGALRTWNVAQANTKIAGGKVPGPIYGLIDKKHDFKKFKAAMPGDTSAPAKNRERNKEVEDDDDLTTGYELMGNLRKTQALNVKSGNYKGADLARRMSKSKKQTETDPLKALEADAERFTGVSKDITRLKALEKKDAAGEKLTLPERKELSKLKDSTLEYRTKKGVAEKALQDFTDAKTSEDLKKVFASHIKDKTRIDNREAVVTLLKKIKEVSEGKEAVDLHLQMKRIFRNKSNAKAIDELVAKYQKEVSAGREHLDAVDKVLAKYDSGEDISINDLKTIQSELTKMLPVMSAEKKYDLKGFAAYTSGARKIKDFLDKKIKPRIDDIEDLIEPISKYHENLKKENKKNRSLKEDILYNIS
jgi:hypothetical protein